MGGRMGGRIGCRMGGRMGGRIVTLSNEFYLHTDMFTKRPNYEIIRKVGD